MARKSLAERRAEALAELDAAKQRVAKLETDAAERIGKLAIKAGLVDLDMTDEQLSEEFGAIASKFRIQATPTVKRGARNSEASAG